MTMTIQAPSNRSKREQEQREALSRAVNGRSLMNYPAIIEGFSAKGIPVEDIRPRENVFTYHGWKALKRQVRKGEHGVRVTTWIVCEKRDKTTGDVERFKRPKTTTVFHVSQTDPAN